MSDGQKDTIYIDVDDEITSIIDKVQQTKHHIVALVLPKRAAMLQSSVNMKLLKKAADSARKQVVLITTEAGLLPLAGTVGLYTAKTLQSKPEIPEAAETSTPMDELVAADDAESAEEFDPDAAKGVAVGELAGAAADEDKPKAKPELAPRPIPRAKDDSPVELDNSEPEEAAAGAAAKSAKPKDKKLKVPNFEKFRLRLILAALGLIILIILFILANIVLPHATISIKTNSSDVGASLTLNLSTAAKAVDPASSTLPAQLQQTQKSQSQQVNTTGQLNKGQTATGNVSMSVQECGSGGTPDPVPAGTGVTSGSSTYITQSNVSFSFSSFKNGCVNFQGNTTPITAKNAGSSYNTAANATFSVNGRSDVTATGSASGGTDNVVQVVSQADINNATQKLSAVDTSQIKTSLVNDLKAGGFYPIPVTFNAGTPTTTTSANAGDQASTVTVTQNTTYTMFGIHQSDLQALIDSAIDGQIDTNKQGILDDGLTNANFNSLSQSSSGAQVSIQDTATVGPKLDIAKLKTQIAGKKAGDVKSIIGSNPGVTSVSVHFSPFWVGSTPKNTSKITIKLTKSSHQ